MKRTSEAERIKCNLGFIGLSQFEELRERVVFIADDREFPQCRGQLGRGVAQFDVGSEDGFLCSCHFYGMFQGAVEIEADRWKGTCCGN